MNRTSRTTLGGHLGSRAETLPDRVVFCCEDGDLTYGRLWERAQRISSALIDRGIGAGETVAVLAQIGTATLEIWVGLALAGIIEVPLNPALRGASLLYQLNHAGCRAVVIDAEFLDRLWPIEQLPTLELVIVVGSAESGPFGPAAMIRYDDLLAENQQPATRAVAPSDTAVICFTSGTTGPPKGVMLSHAANFKLAEDVKTAMEYGPDDVLLSMFPFSHINARYTCALAATLANARVVFTRGFSASKFWDQCRKEGVTAFNYLGGIPTFLLNQPPAVGDLDHQVRRAYGAGSSAQTIIAFKERFGVPLVEVLGSTEMGTICANTLGESRPGSCGRPVGEFEVSLHDEEGWPVPPGAAGEVVIRPREPDIITSGYYRNPESTVEAFRGVWFHTGDRCRRDDEGWFYFVDRVKDSIRRRGENISSWEVEQAALSHPAVAEAAAVGVKVDVEEEEVLLVVVPDRSDLTPEEILDHCRGQLPYFALPRFVRLVDRIPRNASQRVMKEELRTQGVDGTTWDRTTAGYEVSR